MQVWNLLHMARWKYITQKWRKKSPSAHHFTTFSGYIFASKACIDNRKKNLLNSNISSTCPHNMANFGPLTAEIGSGVWDTPPQILTGFVSWLHYCSDVVHRRSTKLCTMLGHLLDCYTIYTFSGALAPWRNFATCKIYFASKSCILYWQHYYTALQQHRASAKLCGVVQGMELQKFHKRRHLYSVGRPSRWALAHILVFSSFWWIMMWLSCLPCCYCYHWSLMLVIS